MSVNLFEAIVSNLSFAFWPDNARAGMALLLTQRGEYDADLTQDLAPEWFSLYLAWNACFIWPSHYMSDMMCFSMLASPAIALGRSTPCPCPRSCPTPTSHSDVSHA